jgi:hypothetical protein
LLPTPVEVAWAAGLFEGEGCLTSIHQGEGRINLVMKLGMTDEDVVRKFARIVGCGNVREQHPTGRGRKTSWHWYCGAQKEIERLVAFFSPYFGTRRLARASELLEARRQYVERRRGDPRAGKLVA